MVGITSHRSVAGFVFTFLVKYAVGEGDSEDRKIMRHLAKGGSCPPRHPRDPFGGQNIGVGAERFGASAV